MGYSTESAADTLGGRLRQLRVSLHLTGEEIAEALGVSRGYWSAIENDKREPGKKLWAALHKVFAVNREWVQHRKGQPFDEAAARHLVDVAKVSKPVEQPATSAHSGGPAGKNVRYPDLLDAHAFVHLRSAEEPRANYEVRELLPGAGPHRSDIAHSQGLSPAEPERAHALLPVTHDDERPLVLTLEVPGGRRDWEVIPMYLDAASAGTVGAPEATGPPHAEREIDKAGDLAMTQRWITRNLGFARGPLRSVDVLGDSMFPTLQDSETIIVDEGAVEEPVDGIYVIDLYGRRLVKRLQFKLDGSIVLISDNEKYEREVISRGQARDVQLVGRMVWPRVR